MYCKLSQLEKEAEKDEGKGIIKKAIFEWIIGVTLLSSIDFTKHKLLREKRVSQLIHKELDAYFCFERLSEESDKPKGCEIYDKVQANISSGKSLKESFSEVTVDFCKFLKGSDGKCLESAKAIVDRSKELIGGC